MRGTIAGKQALLHRCQRLEEDKDFVLSVISHTGSFEERRVGRCPRIAFIDAVIVIIDPIACMHRMFELGTSRVASQGLAIDDERQHRPEIKRLALPLVIKGQFHERIRAMF